MASIGVIGAGTNRMNIYTVRKATQGLANYIIKQGGRDRGVAIAYDSRRMSPEFADEAALCLAANGIRAYVFDALPSFPLHSVPYIVFPVLSLPQATIPRNITGTRLTGKMVHR